MSDFKCDSLDTIIAEATGLGCTVVVGAEDELLIDADSPEAVVRFHAFKERYEAIHQHAAHWESWKSRNGNDHFLMKLAAPTSVEARIAMQAMAGSDPFREFAALRCHQAGSPHAVILFKPSAGLRP